MNDQINSLSSNGGQSRPKYDFGDKDKKEKKKKQDADISEIRDIYLSKEKSSHPEYSRDPKIRKLLQQQVNKTKSQSES
ncbi:MAG: hypothetical protein ACI9S8_001119 [Chlamydiales bacterium]|jgi:hypothetical protein